MSDKAHTIRQLLAEVCAVEPASITADKPLIDYGLDSARAIDLIVALEGEFGVRIPDEAAAKMRTFQEVVSYIDTSTAP